MKVYLVWHWCAETNQKELVEIFSGNDAKIKAQKFADELQSDWGDINTDDYYEVQGWTTA